MAYDLHEHFLKDRYAAHSGIELIEISTGYAKARMPLKDFHFNSVKTVHGGAMFTLADFVFAAASNSRGTLALAANVSVSFLKAVTDPEEVLTAEGREVNEKGRLGIYEVRVTDESGDLVAVFQGMAYRKKDVTLESFWPEEAEKSEVR